MYRIFVTTCDKYLPALLPFAHLLNKYWSPRPPVIVVGYSKPEFVLPENFSFVSLGRQEEYPFQRWSDALIKFLHSVTDEVFILMLEDYWLTRSVDTHAVFVLYQYMLQFEYVLKFDLCGDRLYAYGSDLNYGTVEYLDIVKSMPGSPYHMSLMAGLWRRKHLLRCLEPNESPHDLEIIGSTRVSHIQDVIVLGTRQWPVRHTLALRAQNNKNLLLDELAKVDIDEMAALGLLRPWGIG